MKIRGLGRLNLWRRHAIDWLQAQRPVADPLAAPHRWLLEPPDVAGRDVCLLVTWNRDPCLSEHATVLARAWAAQGVAVILIVASDDIDGFDTGQDLSFCTGILLRANIGYDFAAWSAAIRLIPDVTQARLLVLANDSVFGPLDGFTAFLDRARADAADVVGTIGSRENRPHVQSFLLFFKPAALRHPVFRRFWNRVRSGDRAWAIRRYEERLQQRFTAAGLSVGALYPPAANLPDRINPGLTIWRELVEDGFPFVKIQLLRDNPAGTDIADWPAFLAVRGYDPAIVQRYLAANPPRPTV